MNILETVWYDFGQSQPGTHSADDGPANFAYLPTIDPTQLQTPFLLTGTRLNLIMRLPPSCGE